MLFVGHDASRTGAPVLMASMLRWLRLNVGCELEVLLARGGPLLAEMDEVASCRVVDGPLHTVVDRLLAGIGSVRGEPLKSTVARRLGVAPLRGGHRQSASLVVANSLAALELASVVATPKARMVCHVHELDHVADRVLPRSPATRSALLDSVDTFVATGPAVAKMLVERWGIAPPRVEIIDAFIEVPVVSQESIARARRELASTDQGATAGPLLVSVGAMRRRKGPEVFVDLLGLLADRPGGLSAAWVGGDPESAEWAETKRDIEEAGLDGRITLIGATGDATPFIAAADVLVSVAREDPFPLVVLEAGALGVPVAGFDSGGLGYMLEASGWSESVTPIGDSFGLAQRIAALLDDDELRRVTGQKLQSWVLGSHLIDDVAPRLWEAYSG